MYRYQRIVHFCVFIILVALVYHQYPYNPFKGEDIRKIANVDALKSENALYKEIEEKSAAYNMEPENAVIDRVWKKTPGRNGLKVNVEKSYKQMKKLGKFREDLLVYEQIPPAVTFDDLPASPVYRGHPEKNMVALLINVSWGTEHIPAILNILKEHNVKATFFLEGQWAKENADFVKMIDEQGHTIGNHAYNHPDMARLSNEEINEQITKTNEIITAIIDKKPKWFAPPSGSFSDQVVKIAHGLHMETILWTVDTIDWKKPSVSVMINRINSKIHPGATILMHPTVPIVQGLPVMIKDIKAKGYKIGTIDQLLSEER